MDTEKGDTTINGDTTVGSLPEAEQLKKDLETERAKIADLEDKLGKKTDKEQNFANLRKQKDEAEARAEALEGQMDEKINAVKNEIFQGFNQDHYNDILKSLAGSDEELKKKIEHEYNTSLAAVSPTSKEAITSKLMNAYRLATPQEDHSAMNSAVISSSGGAVIRPSASPKSFSSDEKELAQKLAKAGGIDLSDEDFK